MTSVEGAILVWLAIGVGIALFLVLMFIGLSNDINRLGGG